MSCFDIVASQVAKPACFTNSSILHFEQTWESYFDQSYMRVSPRNTGKGPGLLDLPAEIRLEIYSHLHKPPYFSVDQDEDAPIDVAKLLVWKDIPKAEMVVRKSWSWILTHPVIFREAIDKVLSMGAVIFYNLDGIAKAREEQILRGVRNVVLEFGEISPEVAQKALHSLQDLPQLKALEIKVTPSTLTLYRLQSLPPGSFKALQSVSFHCPEDEAEELREWAEKWAEKQSRKQELEHQRAEAEKRLVDFNPDGRRLSVLEDLQHMKLETALLTIKMKILNLSTYGVEDIFQRGLNPTAEARVARQEVLAEQARKLGEDLGMKMGHRWGRRWQLDGTIGAILDGWV